MWNRLIKWNLIKIEFENIAALKIDINWRDKWVNNYAKKIELIKKVVNGEKIIIIDPEGEYKKLCKNLNGKIENEKITFNE